MKFDLNKVKRKSLDGIKPYSTARDEFKGDASVFLDANENPFNTEYNRYPDPSQEKLKATIAELNQVEPNQIILGNGSDEIIDLLFRAFCEPGVSNVIIPQPTYGMYSVSAAVNNIEVKQPSLDQNFQLDVAAVFKSIDPNTKLIFLCSPNNPSGNLLQEENVIQLLGSFNGIIVVDEAYIDFASSDGFLPSLSECPNLVVMQTFSKAWGLAGLRLGVGFASKEIVQLLNTIKPPYNINSVTQNIALATIQNEAQKIEQVSSIIIERELMSKKLSQFSFVRKIYPSDANFLLVKVINAQSCYDYLLSKGIIVRNRSSVIHCENCLRITIGTEKENEILIEMLKAYEESIIY